MTTVSRIPEVKKFYDPVKAREDLREYNADLSIDLMRQGGLYAWYSSLLVQADEQLEKFELNLSLLEAKLDQNIREEASVAGTKLTEGQINKRVALDSRVIDLKRRVIEAKAEVGYLKSTCVAFAQRKDMLVQLGLLRRKEEEAGGLAVRASARENHDARMRRLQSLDPLENENV